MTTVVLPTTEQPKTGPKGSTFTLQRRDDSRLWLVRENWERPVWVRRCFPWSEPVRYVSLRNDDDEEVALIGDPSELDDPSRHALEEALAEAGFLFELTEVLGIEEEVEIRHWRVVTRQGERAF